jgi:hypothetical protein
VKKKLVDDRWQEEEEEEEEAVGSWISVTASQERSRVSGRRWRHL